MSGAEWAKYRSLFSGWFLPLLVTKSEDGSSLNGEYRRVIGLKDPSVMSVDDDGWSEGSCSAVDYRAAGAEDGWALIAGLIMCNDEVHVGSALL